MSNSTSSNPRETLQEQISSMLQVVMPVLDIAHELPFYNEWLLHSPGCHYIQFFEGIEEFLLFCWGQLKEGKIHQVQKSVRTWNSQQKRDSQGILKEYYKFYENLGEWARNAQNSEWRGNGSWQDYIIFVVTQENHLLRRMSTEKEGPHSEELELIAQYYLQQMQQISVAEPYTLGLEFFTWLGVFTQESYFIPQISFMVPQKKALAPLSRFQEFQLSLKETDQWATLARELIIYLQEGQNLTQPSLQSRNGLSPTGVEVDESENGEVDKSENGEVDGKEASESQASKR